MKYKILILGFINSVGIAMNNYNDLGQKNNNENININNYFNINTQRENINNIISEDINSNGNREINFNFSSIEQQGEYEENIRIQINEQRDEPINDNNFIIYWGRRMIQIGIFRDLFEMTPRNVYLYLFLYIVKSILEMLIYYEIIKLFS